MTNDKPESKPSNPDPLAFSVSGTFRVPPVPVPAHELDEVAEKAELLVLALQGLAQRLSEHAQVCEEPGDQQYAVSVILDLAKQINAWVDAVLVARDERSKS